MASRDKKSTPSVQPLEGRPLMSTITLTGAIDKVNKVVVSRDRTGLVVEQWFNGKSYSRNVYGPQYDQIVWYGGKLADTFDASSITLSAPVVKAFGGGGNDVLIGGRAADQIEGGPGDDVLIGGLGNDTLRGNDGNDILYGEAGIDSLYGDAGADRLYGGNDGSADNLFGGAGADSFYAELYILTSTKKPANRELFRDYNASQGDKTY